LTKRAHYPRIADLTERVKLMDQVYARRLLDALEKMYRFDRTTASHFCPASSTRLWKRIKPNRRIDTDPQMHLRARKSKDD